MSKMKIHDSDVLWEKRREEGEWLGPDAASSRYLFHLLGDFDLRLSE